MFVCLMIRFDGVCVSSCNLPVLLLCSLLSALSSFRGNVEISCRIVLIIIKYSLGCGTSVYYLANHYLSYSSHHGHVLQVSVFCSCTLLLCLGMYSMVSGLSARRLLRDEKNTDFCRPYRRQKMEKTRAML